MNCCRPETIEDAVSYASNPNAKFLAGGTDLVLQIRQGRVKPSLIIDLGHIKGLKLIEKDGDYLFVGSMVTFAQLEKNRLVCRHIPPLQNLCQTMGSPQIRNQATIGGNLGNCSPAADALPLLLAAETEVVIHSTRGAEIIPLNELLKTENLLSQGSLIVGFRIPDRDYLYGFAKLGRREAMAIARLNAAIGLKISYSDHEPRAEKVNVAIGSVSRRTFISNEVAQALEGEKINHEWYEKLIFTAKNVVRTVLGDRASAPYKREAIAGVVNQALISIKGELGHD